LGLVFKFNSGKAFAIPEHSHTTDLVNAHLKDVIFLDKRKHRERMVSTMEFKQMTSYFS